MKCCFKIKHKPYSLAKLGEKGGLLGGSLHAHLSYVHALYSLRLAIAVIVFSLQLFIYFLYIFFFLA